jgi:putative ABC transport system permease protein
LSFIGLILRSVYTRKVRTALTAVAVALGVGTVVTLGVVTHSLRQTAIGVLQTGQADFTVAQKGVSDVLFSTISNDEFDRIRTTPGIKTAIGVLVSTKKYNAANPLFLEIGIQPQDLAPFGVSVLQGRAFAPTATKEIMLGYRAAESLGKHVGDNFTIDGLTYQVVGIFRTGNSFGDSASMFPLPSLQSTERLDGNVTLVFAKVQPGVNIDRVRAAIERANAQLTTARTQSEFGQIDRSLQLISAADRGSTILALLIGAVIVANTMLLSFSERTREFGLLRAVGWGRWRVVGLVIGEALIVGIIGAAVGVGLSFVATASLKHATELRGILHPEYSAGVFWRALYVAGGTALLGALYPALRAASLEPLVALRHE